MSSTAGTLDIVNMALGFAGQRTIASLRENTPEAVQCDLFWDRARRSALQDYPWNFARRRVRLAETLLPDAYSGEWRHAYGLPDGCLKVLSVGEEGRPYRVRSDGANMFILSGEPKAWADCVFDTPETGLWSELFVMAMARKLACLIAVPLLKNNTQKLQELEQLYQEALPKATGQDASEERSCRKPDRWLAARGAW